MYPEKEKHPMTVEEYIKADRQWPRTLRIARAEYMLKITTSASDAAFWRKIIKLNKD